SICFGDSFLHQGYYYKKSTVLGDTFTTKSCDSVHLNHIIVKATQQIEIIKRDSFLSILKAIEPVNWFLNGNIITNENDTFINANFYGKGTYQAAFNYQNCINYSDKFNYIPTQNHISNHTQLQIFPNPSSNSITIKGNNIQQNSTYAIFNSLGKVCQKGQLNHQINVKSLQSGIYYITIQSYNNTSKTSFVKK
ncbi:MAG: T9SS type A sorting domain-containing protein, partial [Bacteroidia bacterium]